MAAPIPWMFKYSIIRNFLNSPPILITLVSKFMVCKVLYFEAQYALGLRSPLILFDIYYYFYTWFSTHFLSQPVHCLSTEIQSLSDIIFPTKPHIYYKNICILPRKIPMNIQITYFRTWNSLTFRRFQLSAILFAFSKPTLTVSFRKIATFYYF